MRVSVIGLGKVGSELSRYMQHLGHEVIGLDTNPEVIERLRGTAAFSVTHDALAAYATAEASILIVPTPQEGDRLSSGCIRMAGEEARKLMPEGSELLIASTLDPRDAAEVCTELNAIFSPVFVRLGSVFEDLNSQPFLLLGMPHDRPTLALHVWRRFHDGMTDYPVVVSDPTTIACAKLAINATLSSRIAWANDVAVRAKAFGADPAVVCKIVGMDPRIGPAFLSPGFPPGGPCLPRDFDVWLSAPGQGMAEAVLVSHRISRQRILAQIMEELKSRPIKTVLVIGLTYKEGGLDWTDALGIAVVKDCVKQGYEVFGYDREGTPADMLAKMGTKRVEADQPFREDAIIVGMPGYPEELAHHASETDTLVINPWR